MRFLLIATALFAVTSGGIVVAQQPSPPSPDPQAVTAGRYEVEPSHTRVQFTVSHMGFTNWYGDLTQASGTLICDTSVILSLLPSTEVFVRRPKA